MPFQGALAQGGTGARSAPVLIIFIYACDQASGLPQTL